MKIKLRVNKRILILCEDKKSSVYYFKSFKSDEEYKRKLSAVDIEVHHPRSYDPLGLVNEAIKRQKEAREDKNDYNDIWVVFDKDKHKSIPAAFDLAKKNNINIAISIICFEYWVLLHFEKTTKPFHSCDELVKYLKNNHYNKYSKSRNCFDDLRDKLDTALSNGKWLEKQIKTHFSNVQKVYSLGAYTNVNKLVEELIK